MVFYLKDHLNVTIGFAGLIAGLTSLCSIIAAPVAGRLYDAIRDPKKMLFVAGLGCAAGLAATSANSIYGAILSTVLVGISNGAGFVIAYAAAREMGATHSEYEALGLGWITGVAVFGSSWSPVLFSWFVTQYSYQVAWLALAASSLLLIVPILTLEKNHTAIS